VTKPNVLVGVPKEPGSVRQGWWVLPDGQLVEVEYGPDAGHLDYLFANLRRFHLSNKDIVKLEGLEVSDAALSKGAIRMVSAFEGGRLVIGADMDTRRLANWKKLRAALLEIGLPAYTPVFILDPWKGGEESEKETTVGALMGTGVKNNPATWENVKALGVQLDCYLTSRRDPFMRQAYANTVDPVDFANGSEWYLGDGGYSRMVLRRDGTLMLTHNSIPRTRAKWDDSEALKLRKAIEEGMKELYGSEFETNPDIRHNPDLSPADFERYVALCKKRWGGIPPSPKHFKTVKDVDAWRHGNWTADGSIMSRFQAFVVIFGRAKAEQAMRELESRSWKLP